MQNAECTCKNAKPKCKCKTLHNGVKTVDAISCNANHSSKTQCVRHKIPTRSPSDDLSTSPPLTTRWVSNKSKKWS